MGKELLQIIAEQAGYLTISDMRFTADTTSMKAAIGDLNAQSFSLREWEDAVHYLTGKKRSFCSENDAQNYLLSTKIYHKPWRKLYKITIPAIFSGL